MSATSAEILDLVTRKEDTPLTRSVAVMAARGMAMYEIADITGLTVERIHAIVETPAAEAIIRRILSQASDEQYKQLLAAAASDAIMTVRSLLKCTNESTRFNAAKYIIDRRLGEMPRVRSTVSQNIDASDPVEQARQLEEKIARLRNPSIP